MDQQVFSYYLVPLPPEDNVEDLLLYEPTIDNTNSAETISNLLNYIAALKVFLIL